MATLPRTKVPRPVLERSVEPETKPPRVRATLGTTTLRAWLVSAERVMTPLSAKLLKPPKFRSPLIWVALLMARAEPPERSKAPFSKIRLFVPPTGPEVGTVPTPLWVELALTWSPESPATVRSLVKTDWPPRDRTPPPLTRIGCW